MLSKWIADRPTGDIFMGTGDPGATSCKEISKPDGGVAFHQAAFGGSGFDVGVLLDGGRVARSENVARMALVSRRAVRLFAVTASTKVLTAGSSWSSGPHQVLRPMAWASTPVNILR